MLYPQNTLFLRVCKSCGIEKYVKGKREPASGLCHSCATRKPLHASEYSIYPQETLTLFWSHIDKTSSPDGCWLWMLHTRNGYGSFTFRDAGGIKHTVGAHRFAFQAEHGVLPSHIFVCHKPPCITPRCVRHLYAGTRQENARDAKEVGRFSMGDKSGSRLHPDTLCWGEKHHHAKLSNADVALLRTKWATGLATRTELAAEFAIHPQSVTAIINNRARPRG